MTQWPTVFSFFKGNIPHSIIAGQKAVFDHCGIPLVQDRDDRLTHGQWLDRLFRSTSEEIIVVADIDAFPLKRSAYESLVSRARQGEVAGLAQVANHKPSRRPYAGPMLLAVRRDIYQGLGMPSLDRGSEFDAGQGLSEAAMTAGVPLHLVYPSFAIQPKWALGDRAVFGIGTFYGNLDFFHLFESRKRQSVELFEAVSRDTVKGTLDFADYLDIMSKPRWRFWA